MNGRYCRRLSCPSAAGTIRSRRMRPNRRVRARLIAAEYTLLPKWPPPTARCLGRRRLRHARVAKRLDPGLELILDLAHLLAQPLLEGDLALGRGLESVAQVLEQRDHVALALVDVLAERGVIGHGVPDRGRGLDLRLGDVVLEPARP